MARTTKAVLEAENKELRGEIEPIAEVAKQLLAQSIAREFEARQQGVAILTYNMPDGRTTTEYAREVLKNG